MQRLLLRMIGQEEIGRRIYEAREDMDWTQQQLADAIGVATAQSISRYERGQTEVPAKRLRRIAEATGKPMSFFVREPEEQTVDADDMTAMRDDLRDLRRELLAEVRATREAVDRVLDLFQEILQGEQDSA